MEASPSAWPFQQRLKSTSFNHQPAAATAEAGASSARDGRAFRRTEGAAERATLPLAALNQATVSADGASLELVWDDGARSSFHWEVRSLYNTIRRNPPTLPPVRPPARPPPPPTQPPQWLLDNCFNNR